MLTSSDKLDQADKALIQKLKGNRTNNKPQSRKAGSSRGGGGGVGGGGKPRKKLYIIMIPNATCNFMLRICKIGFLTYIYIDAKTSEGSKDWQSTKQFYAVYLQIDRRAHV